MMVFSFAIIDIFFLNRDVNKQYELALMSFYLLIIVLRVIERERLTNRWIDRESDRQIYDVYIFSGTRLVKQGFPKIMYSWNTLYFPCLIPLYFLKKLLFRGKN